VKQALTYSTRAPQCPLSSQEVFGVGAPGAAAPPHTTQVITQKCVAAFPHYPNIRSSRVLGHLRLLQREGRVLSYSGGTEPEILQELGVQEPHSRRRYWVSQQTSSHHRPGSC
jgi:hypothetical protein